MTAHLIFYLPLIRFVCGSAPPPRGRRLNNSVKLAVCRLPLRGRFIGGEFIFIQKVIFYLSLIRFACGSAPSPLGRRLNPSVKPVVCHLPFRGRLIGGKFILTSKYRDLSRSLILFFVEFLMLLVYNKQNKNWDF